jgi:hypothetical protein
VPLDDHPKAANKDISIVGDQKRLVLLLPSSASLVGILSDVGYGKWCATSKFRFHILRTSRASLLARCLLSFKPLVVLSKCCHLASEFLSLSIETLHPSPHFDLSSLVRNGVRPRNGVAN